MKLNSWIPELVEWNRSEGDAYVYYGDEHSSDQLHVKQCGWMQCRPEYSFGPAVRDHLLIHFVISGKGEVSVDEKRFEVGEGQLFVIPPHAVSYYNADQQQPWSYYYLGFRGRLSEMLLDVFRQDKASVYLREFSMETVLPLLEEMCSRMLAEDGYLHVMSGMYKLISILSDTRGVGEMEYSRVNREQVESLINKVITKIERNNSEHITVQRIADELGVNRSYLTEHFKRYTGQTIKGYIMELRMKHAQLQMRNLELDIQHVAANCGYSDPLYFSRIFKKYVGCSPSEYRRKVESGEIKSWQKSIINKQKSIDGS